MTAAQPNSTPSQPGKTGWRRQIRAARRDRRPAERAAAGEALALQAQQISELWSATTVCLYESTATEPDTAPLRVALREAGVQVLLPVVTSDVDGRLRWHIDGETNTKAGHVPGSPGVLDATMIATASVVVVPALAVDANGIRLGQGGGHYDRTLPHRAPASAVVAVVFSDELLPSGALPAEPHDIRVDAVLTPMGYRQTIHS